MASVKLNKQRIPWVILIFFGIILFTMGITNHYFFRTYTFDYGNYNFAFWDYAHFRISPMPTYPGNFLQDHFSFTLMYFVPLYWLLNWLTGTYTLILIQTSLIMIAAWYTYQLIRLKSDNIWLGAGVLFYYFTLLGRYTTFSCDVNIAVISACFIPVFLYFFETRKYVIAFIILILSLLSRENIPIWFVFIFLVLIIEHRKDKNAVLLSILGMTLSVAYFILLFKVLIPSVETDEKQFTLFNYSALGATPGEALVFVLQHPVETIKLFFVNHLNDPAYDGVKTEFYLVYLISGGLVLFFRPQYLIWFIPIVAQKVLNDSVLRWGIATYYSIEVVTLLPLSVFLVLSGIKKRVVQNTLVAVTCLATLLTTFRMLDAPNHRMQWVTNPFKEKIYYHRYFKPDFDIQKVNSVLKKIPPQAAVSASQRFFPHLSQRFGVTLFPTVADAQYVLFSVFDDYFMHSHEVNEAAREKIFSDPNWQLIAEEHPVFLFKRKEPGSNKSFDDYFANLHTDTLFCSYEILDQANQKILFNNQRIAENSTIITNQKSFSDRHSIELSPKNPFSSITQIKIVPDTIKLQVSAWYFSKEEKRAHIIANCGKGFYFINNEPDTISPSGWKRLTLNFWLPQQKAAPDCSISLWNTGSDPVYFDDLRIIKFYKEATSLNTDLSSDH